LSRKKVFSCFVFFCRIYSSAVYNDDFKQFTEPEILRKPVEDLILQMKDLGIDRLSNFPFPTPPDETSIKVSENLLVQLGALAVDKMRPKFNKDGQVTKITSLGKTMACFPINPRYSKMLTLANQHNLLQYVITLISALSVQELFMDGDTVLTLKTNNDDEHVSNIVKIKFQQLRQAWAGLGETLLLGDLTVLLVALGAVEYEDNDGFKFCEQNGIRYKAILEAKKLRKQLTDTGRHIMVLEGGLVGNYFFTILL
jgi:ATP-dependent RNA helicase DHX37/DHR1